MYAKQKGLKTVRGGWIPNLPSNMFICTLKLGGTNKESLWTFKLITAIFAGVVVMVTGGPPIRLPQILGKL